MLQFITHNNDRYDYLQGAREALEGGCRWIQLRVKDQDDKDVEALALELKALCAEFGAVFIIDDRVQLVKRIGADGVHLGKNDMAVGQARQILGSEVIIGGTANTMEDVMQLYRSGVNYVGLGPFRFTTTKKNLSQILGLEGYEKIIGACREKGVDLPIVAIGGITVDDIADLMRCGLSGIALSGSILSAESPREQTGIVMDTLARCKE